MQPRNKILRHNHSQTFKEKRSFSSSSSYIQVYSSRFIKQLIETLLLASEISTAPLLRLLCSLLITWVSHLQFYSSSSVSMFGLIWNFTLFKLYLVFASQISVIFGLVIPFIEESNVMIFSLKNYCARHADCQRSQF